MHGREEVFVVIFLHRGEGGHDEQCMTGEKVAAPCLSHTLEKDANPSRTTYLLAQWSPVTVIVTSGLKGLGTLTHMHISL